MKDFKFVIINKNETLKENGEVKLFDDYYDAVDFILENNVEGVISRFYTNGNISETKLEDEDPMLACEV